MTLLQEIIDGIDDLPVHALLRKTKVLASRVDSESLGAWVANELNGYPAEAPVPDYRGPFPAIVMGQFMLPYTTSPSTLEIAPSSFAQKIRSEFTGMFETLFVQPIAELDAASHVHDPSALKIPWSADFVRYVNHLIETGKVQQYVNALLLAAYRVVNPLQLQGVVDAVRTRLLDLTLAFEKLNPESGAAGVPPPPAVQVQQLVTNNIFGGNVNIAQNSQAVDQSIEAPPPAV